MSLLLLAAGHRDLDTLGRLTPDGHLLGPRLVAALPALSGAVVLTTCNRVELYLDVADEADVPAVGSAAIAALADDCGEPVAQVAAHLHPLRDEAADEHLFAVASGLESMVVGEREIVGQVRRALARARQDGTTSPALEGLFQTALRVSRQVEAATGLGATGRSVVAVALDLAEQALGGPEATAHVGFPRPAAAPADRDRSEPVAARLDWSAVRCVLVGTGSYAGASLAALRARGCRDVHVWSASGRADRFADERGARALPPGDDLAAHLGSADLIVTCSGAAGTVLTRPALAAARASSGAAPGRPLVVVDLALHHDVDPQVATLAGVHLVGLHTVAAYAPAHDERVQAARALVADAAAEYARLRRVREWGVAVVAERERALAELAGSPRAAGVDESADRLARRRLRAALHGPTHRARLAARQGDLAAFEAALKELAATHPS